MHGWVDIGGWGRCTQAPCLFVHLSVCGVIATGVTPGAMSVRLLVCGVIAIGVTSNAMSVCMFVCQCVQSLLLV